MIWEMPLSTWQIIILMKRRMVQFKSIIHLQRLGMALCINYNRWMVCSFQPVTGPLSEIWSVNISSIIK